MHKFFISSNFNIVSLQLLLIYLNIVFKKGLDRRKTNKFCLKERRILKFFYVGFINICMFLLCYITKYLTNKTFYYAGKLCRQEVAQQCLRICTSCMLLILTSIQISSTWQPWELKVKIMLRIKNYLYKSKDEIGYQCSLH